MDDDTQKETFEKSPDGQSEDEEVPETPPENPVEQMSEAEKTIHFAEVQAKAIIEDAKAEAEELKAKAIKEAESELRELRRKAREEGYSRGFAEGMAEATATGKIEREKNAERLEAEIQRFLEDAAAEKARLLDETKEDMKNMALAIAEKVIRVSLRSSNDILLRMVDAATDTHKRCEWAHIYIADCDVKGKAKTIPEMTTALMHISDRVKIIPMTDDESGTCIIELPDVILDASVSTQLNNIREVLDGVSPDKD